MVGGKTAVACVRTGDLYDHQYVVNLWHATQKWLRRPHDFLVIDDEAIEKDLGGWWNKLYLFDGRLEEYETVLYLDLDQVILDSLEPFFEFEPHLWFIAIDDWLYDETYNSSVMRFNPKYMRATWKARGGGEIQIPPFRSDQEFITKTVRYDKSRTWPKGWVTSYRWGYLKGKQPGAIVCFHGRPKPHQLQTDDWLYRQWVEKPERLSSETVPKRATKCSPAHQHADQPDAGGAGDA